MQASTAVRIEKINEIRTRLEGRHATILQMEDGPQKVEALKRLLEMNRKMRDLRKKITSGVALVPHTAVKAV